jgi:hypothetical protein
MMSLRHNFNHHLWSETVKLLILSGQATERHVEITLLIFNKHKIISDQQASKLEEFCSEFSALKAQIAFVQLKSQLVRILWNQMRILWIKDWRPSQLDRYDKMLWLDLRSQKIHDKQALVKSESSKSRISSTSETNERTVQKLQTSPSTLSIFTKIQSISPDSPRSSSTSNQYRQSVISAMIESKLAEEYANGIKAKEASKSMILHHNHICTMIAQRGLVMPSQPSSLAPPGATNDKSPEQFAFTVTQVQGTTHSAFSEESPDTSSGRQHSNRLRFHVASAPEKERKAAQERIKQALDQVPTLESMEHTGDFTSCNLYAGNLSSMPLTVISSSRSILTVLQADTSRERYSSAKERRPESRIRIYPTVLGKGRTNRSSGYLHSAIWQDHLKNDTSIRYIQRSFGIRRRYI